MASAMRSASTPQVFDAAGELGASLGAKREVRFSRRRQLLIVLELTAKCSAMSATEALLDHICNHYVIEDRDHDIAAERAISSLRDAISRATGEDSPANEGEA